MKHNITFEIVTNIDKAKKLWNQLSLHKVIDDEWKFRYIFYKYLQYPLYFVAGYDGNKLVGLLPLQYNNLEGLHPPYMLNESFFEFYGGDDMDDNIILLKVGYENCREQFLKQVPTPAVLAPLKEQCKLDDKVTEPYESKYLLSVEGLENYEDYLEKYWQGSSKRKLRQQIRNLYKNYTIEVLENCYADLEILCALNNQRFGKNSSFRFPYRKQIFQDLIHSYQVEMITIMVNGVKEAVSYGIVYKDRFLGMNTGINNTIYDLGKLLVLLQINKAIMCGTKIYDAGKGNSGGWKEAFKFNPVPQYKLFLSHAL